ncbi:MAG TPA: phenylalanine--tRNA ligase subunit beta [Sporichthya sp.]|nr:phenylalanine--tRNA ligase subunit beta [Sporichthya sp.]
MRAPMSWIRQFVPDLPANLTGREVAARIIAAGLEVETVDSGAAGLSGPLVTGRVLSIEELRETQKLKKDIRYCRVDVGPEHNETDGDGAGSRGIVCGARNFAVGDVVVVALPGAVLPGNFEIAARKTYGNISDGMICSERELGKPDGDHAGIIVLGPDTPVGADARAVLGLDDDVLDIAVTADRGYALSIRGIAREVATSYDVDFIDPAGRSPAKADDGSAGEYEIRLEDPACDRFNALAISGVDPAAPSPDWMRRRLQQCGMRPISLAVDISNYVMLELGQPTHAYDRAKLRGPIVVRRARAGEKIETLDGATRDLDGDDLLITDDSGPIGLAGVMGGASTEISDTTTDVLLEAAHFDPVAIARAARRHKLPSEASRRFERGVDPALGPVAALRFAQLLTELGGGTAATTGTDAGGLPAPTTITLDVTYPGRLAGRELDEATVLRRLAQVGAAASVDGGTLTVTAPPWRPDLTDPADVAEEIIRLEGYDSVPSVLPAAPAGRGLTVAQQQRRRVGRALAAAGLVEVLNYPFVSPQQWDAFGLPADDPRRHALRVANPISDAEPEMRTSLLPGLLAALRRNLGRGTADLALYETGRVFLPTPDAPPAPRPPVTRRATADELAATEAALPAQPRHLGVVLTGLREPAGWWGTGRVATWEDAIEAARIAAAAAGADLMVRQGDRAPWHPGRCAALAVLTPEGERVIGHAGELHPRAIGALELPARTAAMELDLDALLAAGGGVVTAPALSSFPPATQDVALVVDAAVPAAEVEVALRAGAGTLLESIRLFDVYHGDQVAPGKRSLAFALRFRAPDRTLTVEEATAARDAAVAAATAATGAVLRG